MNIFIIGAGASGLMCALSAARANHNVTIIDGNEKCGKKMFITGKGRCNLTNDSSTSEFIKNVVTNPKFLYSAINNFSSRDCMELFKSLGLDIVTERGNRVFPASGKSYDVINALTDELKRLNVKIILNNKVSKIVKKDDSFIIYSEKLAYKADRVVIATGGCSYSSTGSQGDGYYFAKSFDIEVSKLYPALVPILIKDNFPSEFNKLELKNVSLVAVNENNKPISLFGEMRFIDKGIDGPIVLKMSSLINKLNIKELYIDLKPALDNDTLDKRLIREFENKENVILKDVLRKLLPPILHQTFIFKSKIDVNTKCNEVSKETRKRIVNTLKHFTLTFDRLEHIDKGIVTSGGINVKELNPKTMESKKVKGLYFIGEVVDVDCFTGGFNMQAAFAMGYVCGSNIS